MSWQFPRLLSDMPTGPQRPYFSHRHYHLSAPHILLPEPLWDPKHRMKLWQVRHDDFRFSLQGHPTFFFFISFFLEEKESSVEFRPRLLLFFSPSGETINSGPRESWDNLYGGTDQWRNKLSKDWLETSRPEIYDGTTSRSKRSTRIMGNLSNSHLFHLASLPHVRGYLNF